ncbi:phospholipase D-like domain-containing protein [Noviherbaspirillum pedocola]|uniref:phospholipase D n=1 Tax=Noviherbaspirillum pedocola TaxID=2801341 RepID=A0A934SPI1_9BURK|nr:phospholipase D-like domain-containing protein [Noviherbaspirillum pedocola]MBK4733084.1 phospholipase D family protein [Noviherbaspirillum pedocola]
MKKLLVPVLLAIAYFAVNAGNDDTLGRFVVAALTRATAYAKRVPVADAGFGAQAPQAQVVEAGFAPEASGEALTLKVIHAARERIDIAAAGLASPALAKALLEAKKRGIEVRVVLQERGSRSKSALMALNQLASAGMAMRTVTRDGARQDSYLIVDRRTVQTGSLDYAVAPGRSDSENVIVIWNNPDLAAAYSRHWQKNFEEGKPYRAM